ncbi:hypothetical protein FJZ53_05710 [Candidatus Woesearchaeota archaeon]|nr:hypothetical protein [Candidatus Woesearchaeota archaeon]
MSSNLKELIDKNLKANDKVLKRGEHKHGNQEHKESTLTKRIKTGAICAAVIAALGLGIYGGSYVWHKRSSYLAEQNRKMVYYQRQFDDVKGYFNRGEYMRADEISERLQEEMGKESRFSPTRPLYLEVQRYDDERIDPEVKRIKREQFYRDLKEFPGKVWDSIPPGGKFIVYACGAGILIYLWRRRNQDQEEQV